MPGNGVYKIFKPMKEVKIKDVENALKIGSAASCAAGADLGLVRMFLDRFSAHFLEPRTARLLSKVCISMFENSLQLICIEAFQSWPQWSAHVEAMCNDFL